MYLGCTLIFYGSPVFIGFEDFMYSFYLVVYHVGVMSWGDREVFCVFENGGTILVMTWWFDENFFG